MNKKELVAKVAKEQNLDPKKLERLTVVELQKMDIVVPDAGADILGGTTSELPPEGDDTTTVSDGADTSGEISEGSSDESATTPEHKPVTGPLLLGYDPVNDKPVYL